jgi:PAS domain S-box-containing protein
MGIGARIQGLVSMQLQPPDIELRQSSEGVPDMVMRFNSDLRYVYVDPAVVDYSGLAQKHIVGRTIKELGSAVKNIPVSEAALRQVFDTGKQTVHEFSFSNSKGECYFESRFAPEFATTGTVDYVLVMTRDITKRKRAEENLRRSEAYLAHAQRLSLTGSFGLNAVTGELTWSKETYRILGYDQSTPPTLNLIFERTHPQDVALFRQIMVCAIAEQINFEFEHRLLMPDGEIKHVRVVGHAPSIELGNSEFVGAFMDVTEQRRADLTLQASELLARGQFNALTKTLDSLASDSNPDKILEHVLQTTIEQLQAHSGSLWHRKQESNLLEFEVAFEHGESAPKTQFSKAGLNRSMPLDALGFNPEDLLNGKPTMLSDIRNGPSSPWLDDLSARGVVTLLLMPMVLAGQVEGMVKICFTCERSFRAEEMELAQALSNQAMMAMQLTRLSAQSRQAAVMAERNRMARDIHDTLAQGFTGVIIQLEAAEDATFKGLASEANEHLSRAGILARECLKEARRSVRALRPQALEEKNLCEALEALIKQMTAGTSMGAEFIIQGNQRPLAPDWEENLLRVGQEALTNALRYAHATLFKLQITFSNHEVRLELCDNGSGFDPATKSEGFGLLGMKERVAGMGGELTVESTSGHGTTILIVLPLTDNLTSLKS